MRRAGSCTQGSAFCFLLHRSRRIQDTTKRGPRINRQIRISPLRVIGADGSVQLPEELLAGWPAGSCRSTRVPSSPFWQGRDETTTAVPVTVGSSVDVPGAPATQNQPAATIRTVGTAIPATRATTCERTAPLACLPMLG